jgi:choline monooxygenase
LSEQFGFISQEDLRQKPIEQAETLPSACYTNPDMAEAEEKAIFSKEWQLAGHISEIPNPGDSLCKTVAGNPVLVVKDDNNQIRTFFNVCKHRGGPVAVKKGTKSVLQCQYHGWTYLMDGSLRGVPQWDRVDLFDKKDFGLTPVASQVWQGLIFVNVNENPHSFDDVIKGISERISPITLEDFQFLSKSSYHINCNWKVYVDNFLEGYHIPIVHPELAKLLDYRNYVTEAEEFYSLQHSPFLDKSDGNLYQTEDGQAFYYFVYPNFMLNILPGRLQTNVVIPNDENNCIVEFYYYYKDLNKPGIEKLIADDVAYSETIQQEDIEICEAVQRGLHSRAYDKGRFSVERELGVYHFQSLIKRSFKNYFSFKD